MLNTKRLILLMVVLFIGLLLTGCAEHYVDILEPTKGIKCEVDREINKAVKHGDLAKIKLLLEVYSEMQKAIKHGDIAKIKLLLAENREKINGPLLEISVAEYKDNKELIEDLNEDLRSQGVEITVIYPKRELINDGDECSATPLHWAAYKGNKEVIEFLISKGANIEAFDFNRDTPLIVAIKKGNKKTVKILIANGADVNNHSSFSPPLYTSLEYGRNDIARLLVENGADVHARYYKGIVFDPDYGLTLLHYAVVEKHKKIAKSLIALGADM